MKHLISILLLSFSISAISQNVTIDYQTWNPSGTTCSLFVSATNVPATGTTSGTIEHQRKLGETRYINSDLSIQIKTEYQTTGAVYKGGRYRIAYNFKSGYTYTIYVTAAAVENTIGYPTGPFIRLDINNNGGGGSTGCNGPEILNYNAGGNPAAVKLSSNSFQEFQFVFPQMGHIYRGGEHKGEIRRVKKIFMRQHWYDAFIDWPEYLSAEQYNEIEVINESYANEGTMFENTTNAIKVLAHLLNTHWKEEYQIYITCLDVEHRAYLIDNDPIWNYHKGAGMPEQEYLEEQLKRKNIFRLHDD